MSSQPYIKCFGRLWNYSIFQVQTWSKVFVGQSEHVTVLNLPTYTPATAMGQTASQSPASAAPAQCPIPHESRTPKSQSDSGPAQCPIDHSALSSRNQMPTLSQAPAQNQSIHLPTERVGSSIPRDADGSKWEYPSPQQFYNALVRKGWETPEEHIETMVEIHNFLNEEAWQEVLKWEKRVEPK